MSLDKTLDKLEDKFYNELDEDRDAIVGELSELHKAAIAKGRKQFLEFAEAVMPRFGGAYIPYIFWEELAWYIEDAETRIHLFDTLAAFAESAFEEDETKKMKPMLICYIAIEKEFELDKIQTLIMDKAHPAVQEYYRKLTTFVTKNKSSVDMYTEKFRMLMDRSPDFELLSMPLPRLKEHLAV